MGILFSPHDIFDVAIQIERNGGAFYRKAAALAKNDIAAAELAKLADMEDAHVTTFVDLKESALKDIEEPNAFDPYGETALYLQSFAQGQVFDMLRPTGDFLGPETPLKDVLTFAIERERDSAVFYLGMKDLVPDVHMKTKIEEIIKQEMGHITLLNRRLQEST